MFFEIYTNQKALTQVIAHNYKHNNKKVSAQNANSDLKITGVIIQRYNNRKLNNEVIEAITSKFGARVFDTKIRECIALAEAPAAHCSIFDYDSKSNGASDYMALANEVLMKLS